MNKKIIGISGILFVLLAAGTAMALANPENTGSTQAKPMYKNFDPAMMEIKEQIMEAVENGDYETWVSLHEENGLPMQGGMFSAINEANFYLLSELHEAKQSGDFERAKEIFEELGIEKGQFKGKHKMNKGFGIKGKFSGNCPYLNSSE